ncbi:MAG TPA: MMPL family transporter [Acetobacteraceae bacterium]|nr:MMPL family transporter [Acetobacteraceae bacterium]
MTRSSPTAVAGPPVAAGPVGATGGPAPPRRPRRLPILLALAASLLFTGLALSVCRIRTDMAALLPHGQDPAARFMLRELRSGAANRLILIGIEGPQPARPAASGVAQAQSAQTRRGQTQPAQMQPAQTQAVQTQAVQTKPRQTRPEQTQPDHKQPDRTKLAQTPLDPLHLSQEQLAQASRALTARLVATGAFTLVRNGAGSLAASPEARFLFAHRYLLSPAVTPEAFTTTALRVDLQRLLAGLRSSAAPLVERFGLADPTGAFLALARVWLGGSRIGVADGVWFAADRPAGRPRALILAETRSGGTDLTAQARVIAAIHAAFAAVAPPGARLVLGGTAILSAAAAQAVRADAELLSILSVLIVAALLLWRFRAPLVIAAIAIPIVLGLGAAALVVQAVYGSVQGIAFGFGMTMLGVSVDYPVLLVGHRKPGEAAPATFRRIGQAFALAATTAILGLSGMVFAGFPAIGQLGLFAVTGLAVAALATGFLLPPLIVAAELAPSAFGDAGLVRRIEPWRRFRPLGLAACAVAALVLVVAGGPHAAHDLAALSPVPAPALAADAQLRAEVGAPDAGQLGLVEGASAEAVLRAEERLAPVLAGLRAAGKIAGVEDAARLFPSRATQRARQAALPPPEMLARRLRTAAVGLGFRSAAFAPFLADVTAARRAAPLGPEAVRDPVLAARLAALLFRRDDPGEKSAPAKQSCRAARTSPSLLAGEGRASGGGPPLTPTLPRKGGGGVACGTAGVRWYGLIAPEGVTDPPFVAARLRAAGVLYVDVAAETSRIVTGSTAAALRRLGWGGLAAVILLMLVLRDPRHVLRVAGAVLAALLLAVALLTAAGVRFSLLQIVALQFAAGVGLDYALFFARPQLDAEERARTLRTLMTCNAMTLLTFGLLATARTPLLRQIGVAVVVGAAASMLTAFLFAGRRPERSGEEG